MVEDLVIAEGTGLVQPQFGKTAPMASAVTPQEQIPQVEPDDEQTVVRPRVNEYVPPAPMTRPQAPPAAGFNPWRIIIPSLAGLLVVFAVIYAFTHSPQTTNSNQSGQGPSLTADPNSQAVQPAAPPTGQNEQGIPLGGASGSTSNPNANANIDVNANVSFSPTPIAQENTNSANANDNRSVNANSNRPVELPSPKSSPASTPQSTSPLAPSPTRPPASPKPTSTPPPAPLDN